MTIHFGAYGIAVGSLLAAKLLLSMPRPRLRSKRPDTRRPAPRALTIHAVITAYNESPHMLARCLESLLGQTRRPDSVTVVDDCSTDPHAVARVTDDLIWNFRAAGIELSLIRFPINRGKRHGLAAGFQAHPDAGAYLCVDSDTIVAPNAVAQLAAPMARRRVHSVTGLVLAHNRATNLLTRLIDMRYVNAFLGERVAYSRLGSVLCACGSLAMYRGWVVRRHLDDFLQQRFLGQPATFGDDRRLTYYALVEGQSLIAPTAIGWTDVPETLGHYIRQQIRWGKSFIREGILLLAKVRLVGRACWWLNLLELATWVAFTVGLLTALALTATHPASWRILTGYALWVCAMAWLRSLHYLRRAPGVPLTERLGTFACAPLYALLNLLLLLPLRLWSLATLRRNGWGTRQQVEIAAAPTDPRPAPTVPAARHSDSTVPLHKLLDPLDATTLEVAIPRR